MFTNPLPKCHALGCTDYSDPRYAIHGPNGKAVPACDGHGNPGCGAGNSACTCPPHNGESGPKPAWEAALDRTQAGQERLKRESEENVKEEKTDGST